MLPPPCCHRGSLIRSPASCQYELEKAPFLVGHTVHLTLQCTSLSSCRSKRKEGCWGRLSSAREPLFSGGHHQSLGKGQLSPGREKGCWGPQSHLPFDSRESAYGCTHRSDLLPQRDMKQNQQGKRWVGQSLDEAKTPLPVRSHRMHLIRPATSCADVCIGVCRGSSGSAPRVLLGRVA